METDFGHGRRNIGKKSSIETNRDNLLEDVVRVVDQRLGDQLAFVGSCDGF